MYAQWVNKERRRISLWGRLRSEDEMEAVGVKPGTGVGIDVTEDIMREFLSDLTPPAS